MLWDSEKLLTRLALGEDSHHEFKEIKFAGRHVKSPERNKLADELAAFGNSPDGGTLMFSVSDAGQVRGMSRQQLDTLERLIREICADSINPPLSVIIQKLPLPDHPAVLVAWVAQSPSVHKSPGGYYARQGSSKRELSPAALSRLFQQRRKSEQLGTDQAIVGQSGISSFDEHLIARILSSRVIESREDQLIKLGLLRFDEQGVLRATVAGVTMGVASQLDARTITGSLDQQIRDAVNFVRLNTKVAARKTPARIETPQFSSRTVFEAIVNAVVHRDYSLEHTKIRLFLFDDRFELYSPGNLPNSLSIEAMRARQVTRNEVLASILRMIPVGDIFGAGERSYILEQRGEGVPVIYEQTVSLTGLEPQYEFLDDVELKLTVPSARPSAEGLEGGVSVSTDDRQLSDVEVVVLYPNKTYLREVTDVFGQVSFNFHAELPMTVFCAKAGYKGQVIRQWYPQSPLAIQLDELPAGGSMTFTNRWIDLPGLTGRLNPKLDHYDRMYLYTDGQISIDRGKREPVHFKLNQRLLLEDANGSARVVRFIEMIGQSVLLEYEVPEHQ